MREGLDFQIESEGQEAPFWLHLRSFWAGVRTSRPSLAHADQSVFRADSGQILGAFLGRLEPLIFRLDAARGRKGRQKVVKIRASEPQWVQEWILMATRPVLKRVFVKKTY